MKKILLFLLVATLGCGNVYSQTKKPVRRTASVAAKQKAEAEAKAKAEAEAKAKAEAEERELNNSKCKFRLSSTKLISSQNNEDYIVYEVPGMTTSELKSSVYTTLTSLFKSPKDAITSVSDNIIQLEGYSPSVFKGNFSSGGTFSNHLVFSIVIQFKDGKVRYNCPIIKYVHIITDGIDVDQMAYIDNNFSDFNNSEKLSTLNYFNNIVNTINSKLKKANDW